MKASAFGAFERLMAMRYLRARRQEGFISVIAVFSLLGIMIGVATLIIVMAVMNGFRAELLGRILGLNNHMRVLSASAPTLTDFDQVVGRLAGLSGIRSASPVVEGQAMATANNIAGGAVVRGIRAQDLMRRPLIADNIRQGSLADLTGNDAIMIGSRMAARMRLRVGDPITLISPQGTETAFGLMPRLKTYRVAAIFEVGMSEYDNTFAFLPLEAAQVFFQFEGGVSGVDLLLDDADRTDAVRREVFATLGPEYRTFDWQQANSSLFSALAVERNVMFLILTLIIVVAAFNIISSLIMLVKDKSRDIAILRTMGATRGAVMRIFFMSGASVGVIGTLLGFAIGVVFNLNIESIRQFLQSLTGTPLFTPEIYFLSRLPARMFVSDVAVVVSMALGLSVLATIYPSWRAARLDPVEALRYE